MVNKPTKNLFRPVISLVTAAVIMVSSCFSLAVQTEALSFFGWNSKFYGEVITEKVAAQEQDELCLLYTSPSPRDRG